MDYKVNSIDQLKDGDHITVQSDPTNKDRALKLLADTDLIKLKEDAGKNGEPITFLDIEDNIKNIKFEEVAGPSLVRMMDDTDAVVLTGTNVAKANKYVEDALSIYDRDDADKYALILSVRENNKSEDWVDAVYKGLKSEETKK